MEAIKDLFDKSKRLDRRIESVVQFSDNTPELLGQELNEYVVTDKLRNSYEKVIGKIEEAFSDSSNEVGIWVSGFYGSGKSSFAKYLGYSFQNSMLVDGVSFGEKLMNRMDDVALKQMHKTIIQKFHPIVIMIDLSTQAVAGKISTVSDLMYYESMRLLGIEGCNDPKVMEFILLLKDEGKLEEFCELVKKEEGKSWEVYKDNKLIANRIAAKYASRVLPRYFSSPEDYNKVQVDSVENEEQRFVRIRNMVQKSLGVDKIIYVLDEMGQYIASDNDLIFNMQGTMQILKSKFKGDVWLIATAQQTLTEDNPDAQLNSDKLYKLNDRFPIKVDIEADDIKEIITKRLLGKSPEGKNYLGEMYAKYKGTLTLGTQLKDMERSVYIRSVDKELFIDLYPFLPVHIDILLALLQKLASRTGGVGLRSVIRLIRDILVDNRLSGFLIGKMAGPEHFYDVLRPDMEKSAGFKEIILSADKAIRSNSDNALAVRICKTIAVMQILDDFNLSFDNLCALLYEEVGKDVNKTEVRKVLNHIKEQAGLTLQEIDGRFRFMTNAILSIQEERSHIVPREANWIPVLKEQIRDMLLLPAPSVCIFGSKTINASVELNEGRKTYMIVPGDSLKINLRFVIAEQYAAERQMVLTESTKPENRQVMYWICTLKREKESVLYDIVKDQLIYQNHADDPNKEVKDYLKAQKEDEENKRRELIQLLKEAQANSEMIFRGTPEQVDETTYKTQALKAAAEKMFAKYEMAGKNMPAKAVEDLAKFENFMTLSPALNALGIITPKGAVDSDYRAFRELKDFIASREAVSGSDVLTHFEQAPYGWSKDTTRYLVALMLKAGMIIVRSGAQTFKMFTVKVAEEMKNNTFFGRVGLSLNVDEKLKPGEFLEAVKQINSLFNPSSSLAPTPDVIAKFALKRIASTTGLIYTAERLKKTFEDLSLAGVDRINRAVGFCKKIIDSEGVEAPYLFAKDKDCVAVFRYVIGINKKDKESGFIDSIRKIRRRLNDIKKLNKTNLENFLKETNEVEQAFNELLANPDCESLATEYNDLSDKLEKIIKSVCIGFYAFASGIIQKKTEKLVNDSRFQALLPKQQAEIQHVIAMLKVTEGDSIELLRDMVNEFDGIFTYGGKWDGIIRCIEEYTEQNRPVVQDSTPASDSAEGATDDHNQPDASQVNKPAAKRIRLTVKRRLTSRQELERLIDELQQKLKDMDAGSSIDFDLAE